ncbi:MULTISPECIES: DUF3299 domain-containing protein [unclassified Imperialibacter]|uniref:DUF3299 domain-containing protein n=1 Tax=unclassified Imperialibacter TaxID=2629706 RepID=UPI001253C223|nr:MULTISPECIES: DUF3299 domain-containing protein [unclassified Imperialibacter]CAD5292724.1 conserved hypothetical protein [Imperialibacter sp. 89]CAD5293780.1 conserved hypothetical protein [Imperialibacter sp. 75]VVT28683.1 conserved hypothetical protein [Imperialibacter sp. EC-SDR9]
MLQLVLGFALFVSPLQSPSLWKVFEGVRFESKYIDEEKASFYIPQFDDGLLQMDGKKYIIKGYYLPIDLSPKGIVLSRYPMATCFFCGEAGPESVMMIFPTEKLEGLKMDDELTFEGTLKLNDDDVYQLSFILTDAKRL